MGSKFKFMDYKLTWGVEVLSVVDSNSNSTDVQGRITKVTWRIQNFSTIKAKKLYSENFVVDDTKWRVLIFPKGNNVDHLSIYLKVDDSANLPSGWFRYVQIGFAVINQFDFKTSAVTCARHIFNAGNTYLGYASLLALSELHNPEKGYLVNDACLVEAYVSSDWIKCLISDELMVKSISVKYGSEEVDSVKANEHEEPDESVSIEPEEPAEEVMRTFFNSLESKYEAKEAITKLDEAFNTTPIKFYDSEKFSSLKQALKILSNSDCSSTMLTIDEKNELLAMEERLVVLAGRATKAHQDMHYFTEKKWMKLTITCNLDRNLIKYKQAESEVKEMQEKITAVMAERKGIFKSSKEMKTDLEILEKECVEFESKAKIADEEVKMVEIECRRMKDFISSIGEKI